MKNILFVALALILASPSFAKDHGPPYGSGNPGGCFRLAVPISKFSSPEEGNWEVNAAKTDLTVCTKEEVKSRKPHEKWDNEYVSEGKFTIVIKNSKGKLFGKYEFPLMKESGEDYTYGFTRELIEQPEPVDPLNTNVRKLNFRMFNDQQESTDEHGWLTINLATYYLFPIKK